MKNIELVNEKSKCCGCGLCAQKCPKSAIEMKEDEYGFVYPYINKEKCINCGICKKVCEYNKERKERIYKPKAYVAVSSNEEVLKTTASGGIFTSIAKAFIEKGGIVFGCALLKERENFVIKHIKAEKINDLENIKGSKYVQSDITSVYEEIKEEIKKGNKVLFSGTPCQVAAIKEFTNDNENLYTIDIICHGVPSSKMFNDYIKYISNKKNITITDFKFRNKAKGWGLNYSISYKDSNNKEKTIIKPSFKSSYYQMFLDSYTYRENCYSCVYANNKRIGDITIGDYWGIEKEHNELIVKSIKKKKKGVSCMIVNSQKGEKIINNSVSEIKSFASRFEKITRHNQQLNNPSNEPKERKYILKEYIDKGYIGINSYYERINLIKNITKEIIYKLPKNIVRLIKK